MPPSHMAATPKKGKKKKKTPSHMVVLPPPMASTEDWTSGDAPRQYVHPEKRAALEQAG